MSHFFISLVLISYLAYPFRSNLLVLFFFLPIPFLSFFSSSIKIPHILRIGSSYLTGGFTANTSLSHHCRDNGLLFHIHRAKHVVIDRQKNHGMHFHVLAKVLLLFGEDHTRWYRSR